MLQITICILYIHSKKLKKTFGCLKRAVWLDEDLVSAKYWENYQIDRTDFLENQTVQFDINRNRYANEKLT